MDDLLSFLDLYFDKLSDQDVFLALLVGVSSPGFAVTCCLYDLESKVSYTYT